MKTSIPLIIAVISVLAAPVACGSQGNSDGKDRPADSMQADAQQGDTASVEEIDAIIQQYLVATDSLASIFERINSVEDIDRYADRIRALGDDIQQFDKQAVRIGTPLIDRMEMTNVDTAFERLRTQRERINENTEMAKHLAEVEGQ